MLRLLLVLLALASTATSAANISAKSILISDISTGQVIYAKNDTAQRSIASITKLVTVMTILEAQQNLFEELLIHRPKNISTYLPFAVKSLPRNKLIELAMVSSDNVAAYNLCHHYANGYAACIQDMNRLVMSWGLEHTHFVDATGLLNQNVSTADDLMVILKHSLDYPYIKNYGALPSTHIDKQRLVFNNTNRLLKTRQDILVTKTGWITASGGCIAMVVTRYQKNFAVILLGSQNTHTRLSEANKLINDYILPVM